MQKIAITAQHINDLSTTSLYCVIDENGGTIGSDSGNNLCLQDQQIKSQHVHIQYEVGFFTITSIADSDIFLLTIHSPSFLQAMKQLLNLVIHLE